MGAASSFQSRPEAHDGLVFFHEGPPTSGESFCGPPTDGTVAKEQGRRNGEWISSLRHRADSFAFFDGTGAPAGASRWFCGFAGAAQSSRSANSFAGRTGDVLRSCAGAAIRDGSLSAFPD